VPKQNFAFFGLKSAKAKLRLFFDPKTSLFQNFAFFGLKSPKTKLRFFRLKKSQIEKAKF
jgi:hypothetical protein